MEPTFPELVLLAWIPVCAVFFAVMQPVRALALAYLIGWLALPVARVQLAGFSDIDKILATNIGVFIGTALFVTRHFKGYRISVADLAVVLFAIGTGITSVVNGLGVYDGASSLSRQVFLYVVPFTLGRMMIKTTHDLREVCRMVVIAAAIYAVPTIWEWRMSPQFHEHIYGYFHSGWNMYYRWGFWRPVVFFPMALALGIFMAWTALLGVAMLRTEQSRPVLGMPWCFVVCMPMLGLLASMSLGPWGLFLVGLGVFYLWRRTRSRLVIWLPVLFSISWMGGRYTGLTDGSWLASAVTSISVDRAASLQYRVDAETLLLERAKMRPVFGWGGWGRSRIRNEEGRDLVATDGLWIIFVGAYGLFGLVAFFLWWCWPLFLGQRAGPALWQHPEIVALLIAVGLQAVNLLFNGFLSPILTMLSGGLVTSLLQLSRGPVRVYQPADRPARVQTRVDRGVYLP